jgi:hypothetical protein
MRAVAIPISITVVIHPRMNAKPFRGPRFVASTSPNATRLNGDAAAVAARTSSDPKVELFTNPPPIRHRDQILARTAHETADGRNLLTIGAVVGAVTVSG